MLGLAHFNADYADRDWVRAYALLTLAQGKGLPQASGALQQMDQYVPLAQRQKAQALARDLEAEADKRRAAQMAAADLRQREPAQPVRVAATNQTSAPRADTAQTSTQPVRVPVSAASSAPASTGMFGDWAVQRGAFGVAANAE